MGNNLEIMKDDYRSIILEELYKIDAVRTCPFCGIEYLTGKEEGFIYANITILFKKKYGENYNNDLMKKVIKEVLKDRLSGHSCDI